MNEPQYTNLQHDALNLLNKITTVQECDARKGSYIFFGPVQKQNFFLTTTHCNFIKVIIKINNAKLDADCLKSILYFLNHPCYE